MVVVVGGRRWRTCFSQILLCRLVILGMFLEDGGRMRPAPLGGGLGRAIPKSFLLKKGVQRRGF